MLSGPAAADMAREVAQRLNRAGLKTVTASERRREGVRVSGFPSGVMVTVDVDDATVKAERFEGILKVLKGVYDIRIDRSGERVVTVNVLPPPVAEPEVERLREWRRGRVVLRTGESVTARWADGREEAGRLVGLVVAEGQREPMAEVRLDRTPEMISRVEVRRLTPRRD